MPFYRLPRFIKLMIDDASKNDPKHPYDVSTHTCAGEKRALEDILKLIELFQDDFKSQAKVVASNKLKSMDIAYNPRQDKMSVDAHFAYAYIEVMKIFGVDIEFKPKTRKISN